MAKKQDEHRASFRIDHQLALVLVRTYVVLEYYVHYRSTLQLCVYSMQPAQLNLERVRPY
jgi:hypothetical protein